MILLKIQPSASNFPSLIFVKPSFALRQHRTKLVRRLRRQIFRQIVQGRRRQSDARQGELLQDDGIHASKMRTKHEARALCGAALKLWGNRYRSSAVPR